eukprot:3820606-Karenia_brevis.AAC.1
MVDDSRDVWTWDGRELDLFTEAQEPWMAKAWKRRREVHECAAEAGREKKAKFTKLDLTALILDKGLDTKVQLMDFAQEYGTGAMQLFDAKELGQARDAARAERQSDWELVCAYGAGGCKTKN